MRSKPGGKPLGFCLCNSHSVGDDWSIVPAVGTLTRRNSGENAKELPRDSFLGQLCMSLANYREFGFPV